MRLGALPDFYDGKITYKSFSIFVLYVTHLDKNSVSNVMGCSQATREQIAHPYISSGCKNRMSEYRGEHQLGCN